MEVTLLWFFNECMSNYQKVKEIQKEYQLDKIILFPDIEDVRNNISDKIGFMAPYLPEQKIRSLFVVKELENKHGILTQQEKLYGVSEEKAIFDRLGLEARKPKLTFANIGGASRLKEWTKEVKAILRRGGNVKGAFLIGPTGSGKTNFVEAFAGELNRVLIMLNLPLIMEMENPIDRLRNVFIYLEKQSALGNKFVLLADEFEKMVDVKNGSPIQKQFLGQILTILNDLNTPAGYKIDVVIFATANNLSLILDENPELLRHGRWSAKFFLNYPTKEEALGIYEMYAKRYDVRHYITEDGKVDDKALFRLYSRVSTVHKGCNLSPNLSVFSPAEINALMERLQTRELANGGKLTDEVIEDTINLLIPIQKTANKGVARQIKDAEYGFEAC